ncbi:hypothetical protein MTR_0084s0060 [Medicago truncatula]|uniref:Putative plant transposon protein domain-containing protein n=1 Tax=Medicago truncatula TaxID=3880 RepID=A0A072THF0_MEDTR|nr:hypothetical protein MTR_0084s0060 [Medicago truncatula]
MVETRNKGKSQVPTQPSKKAKTAPKRQQPVKPNPNTPPPPSVNHRFYNNAVRDRFRDISGYRVIPERGFDFPKLISNPEFLQVFTARGWESLNTMIFEQANKTLGIEFYANARFMGRRYVSYVRGKEIDYSPKRINALLEIVPPEECGAWASFVVQTLEGTSCTSEIPLARLLTVSTILDGLPINVGTKKAIPHLSLINWLCENQDCELFANDLSAPIMKPLNDTYMDSFAKDYHDQLHAIQEYWNRPRFGQEFTEPVCLNRRPMTGSFKRFDGSEEAMDHDFDVTRGRAQDRDQEIRTDFAAGSRQSRYHFGEDTFAEENPATWIPEDQMQD